uniref:LITAF domain-containing protein n=1 Tax=Myripristis murdjan TaxID=586833 RepID=A0A667WEE9_9TELE
MQCVCIFQDENRAEQDVRIYHIHSPFNPNLSSVFSILSSSPVSSVSLSPPRPRFVSYEMELCHSPGLTTCPTCQTQVTTQVTYCVGTHAWLICLLFVLCGLVLGCCLIPFFVRYFKDAYHTCPRCRQVLHIHRKTCC